MGLKTKILILLLLGCLVFGDVIYKHVIAPHIPSRVSVTEVSKEPLEVKEPSTEESLPVTSSEKATTQEDSNSNSNDLKKDMTEGSTISHQIYLTQEKIENANKEYARLEARVMELNSEIAVSQQFLDANEKELAKKQSEYGNFIRILYMTNYGYDFVNLIFSSKGFPDLCENVKISAYLLERMTKSLNELQAKQTQLREKREEMERQQAIGISVQALLKEKRKVLTSYKTELNNIIYSATSGDKAEQMYQELITDSNKITSMIQNAKDNSVVVSNDGKMMFPTRGEITSQFGWRVHPISGVSKFHSGIDIGADMGEPIYSAYNGTVYFAGWFGGYGKAVMVNHGGGYYTLYGHTSEILVKEGDFVQKGQRIALVGSTGYSTGPHLHFEVRVNGEVQNPFSFF